MKILSAVILLLPIMASANLSLTDEGYCFATADTCFDDDGQFLVPVDTSSGVYTPSIFGTPLGGGAVTFHECVCMGGVSFHWEASDVHTDCGNIVIGAPTPNGGNSVAVIVGSIYEKEIPDRRLRQQKKDRELSLNSFNIIVPACESGEVGDPHIEHWNGDWYDWHGECDAVLLHAPDFQNGLGLDIHTRSTIRYEYSYIESVTIRIGDDILEVSSFGGYFFNGVEDVDLPTMMGGIAEVVHTKLSVNDHAFVANLGEGATLHINVHRDIVSIKITHSGPEAVVEWFGSR